MPLTDGLGRVQKSDIMATDLEQAGKLNPQLGKKKKKPVPAERVMCQDFFKILKGLPRGK